MFTLLSLGELGSVEKGLWGVISGCGGGGGERRLVEGAVSSRRVKGGCYQPKRAGLCSCRYA